MKSVTLTVNADRASEAKGSDAEGIPWYKECAGNRK
jgi:hypothetical protein